MNITKQQKNPYIWNYNIKIKTQQGTYDYEKETKEKVKVKKIGRFNQVKQPNA